MADAPKTPPSNADVRGVYLRNARLGLPTEPYPREPLDYSKLRYRSPGYARAAALAAKRARMEIGQ